MASWADFLKKVEDPSPGEAVVKATISWFTDTMKVESPALAEGYTEQMLEDQFPKELPVQACIRRVLRAVDAVSQARRAQQAAGTTSSAQSLAKLFLPSKVADVANLLHKAHMSKLSSHFGIACTSTQKNARHPEKRLFCLWTLLPRRLFRCGSRLM